MSEKPAEATASKPTGSRKPSTTRRSPGQDEIATCAYFIQFDEGGDDQLGHWLRAERELTTG